jgi:serine/threonine protein kinase
MITNEGKVKIMDFGLAKIGHGTGVTKIGTTVGTVAYMSPEQARGEEVDHRTDIWSFGVVLYEMLTGKLPFKGDYEQAVIHSLLNIEPIPLIKNRLDIPEEFEQLIYKCLSKNPDDRYRNMDELVANLKGDKIVKDNIPQAKIKKVKSIYIAAGSILLGLIILFFILKLFLFSKTDHETTREKRSIAVMYFDNLSNDSKLDWLQKGLVELLNASLSQSRELRVVDTQRLSDILNELGKVNGRVSAAEIKICLQWLLI